MFVSRVEGGWDVCVKKLLVSGIVFLLTFLQKTPPRLSPPPSLPSPPSLSKEEMAFTLGS